MHPRTSAWLVSLVLLAGTALLSLPSCGGGGGGGQPGTKSPDEVMIKPLGENRTPLIEATFEDITLTLEAGRTVQWQSAAIHTYFSDPDNDTLEYRATTDNAGVADIDFSAHGPTLVVRALGTGTARITLTATDPGGLSVTQSFTVTVNDGTVLPPDHSDTLAGAVDVVSGDTVEGYLDSPNDVDIFRIPITDTRLIDVTLTSEESGVEIALLDSNGNVLDTAVTASQARLQATAQGGDFFVRVRAVSSTLKSKLQQGAKAFDLVVKVVKNVQSVINILQGKLEIDVEIGGFGGAFYLGEHFEFPAGSTEHAFRARLSSGVLSATLERDVLRISAAHGATPGPLKFTVEASAFGLLSFKVLQVNLFEAPNQPPRTVCAQTVEQTVNPGETAIFPLSACFKDDKPEELGFATRVVERRGTGWRVDPIYRWDLKVFGSQRMNSRDFITVEVTATDPSGQSAKQAFRVNLNRALHPVLTEFDPMIFLDPGGSETIDLTSYYRDPEGSLLTFTLGQIPHLTARLAGSSLTVSANSQALGRYDVPVTVTAADGRFKVFTIKVYVAVPLRALKDLVIRVMAGKMTVVRLAEFIGVPQGTTNPPSFNFFLGPGTHTNNLRATLDAARENLTIKPPSGLQGEFTLKMTATVLDDDRFKTFTYFDFRVIVGEEEGEELGPEWIRAQNVDCHVHRDTVTGIWGGFYSYSGGCRERKAHGRGTTVALSRGGTAPREFRYEVEWNDGRASGRGTRTVSYTDGSETSISEGEFLNGLLHGQGVKTLSGVRREGFRYEGEWQRGVKHGQGTETREYGNHYVGEWRQGQFWNGQATLISYSYDEERYEGQIREGYRNGQGTLTYTDGSRYVGGWQGGVRHGQGTETHPNGSHYVGEWQNGSFHTGQATIIGYGSRFEGAYRDGRRHGQGIVTAESGYRMEGEWRNGDFWNGTAHDPSGRFDTYRNGECIKTTNSDGTDASIKHDDGSTSCSPGSIQ